MHVYCLFCETQRCRQIAAIITKDYGYECIYPQIIQRKWVRGIPTEVCHDWLPGYLFLFSEQPVQARMNISGIIRFLGNGELEGQDFAFAEMIYRRQGVMGTVPLLQEGDKCSIADPAWKEIRGKVVKMDSGRKRCCIEFDFDGITRTVWVGYELIRKDQEEAIPENNHHPI